MLVPVCVPAHALQPPPVCWCRVYRDSSLFGKVGARRSPCGVCAAFTLVLCGLRYTGMSTPSQASCYAHAPRPRPLLALQVSETSHKPPSEDLSAGINCSAALSVEATATHIPVPVPHHQHSPCSITCIYFLAACLLWNPPPPPTPPPFTHVQHPSPSRSPCLSAAAATMPSCATHSPTHPINHTQR